MFNRRFLRIKVFHQLYAYWQEESANRTLHEKNLIKTLEKAYELYIFLLALPAELRFFIDKELDLQQSKFFPQESIINPLKAMHNNKAIAMIEKSELIAAKMKQHKLKWNNASELFRHLWNLLKQNEAFKQYATKPDHIFIDDQKILGELYQVFVADSELFNHYLEEKFINWEDDQVLVVTALLKSVELMKENGGDSFVITLDKGEFEEEKFMKDLFWSTIESDRELTALIAAKTQNWEPERIATVDMMLMKMALCEILKFPHIPVKVSINEYLELAKLYSTPNSHGFINGILDKIQIDLRRENRIQKQGRGLVE